MKFVYVVSLDVLYDWKVKLCLFSLVLPAEWRNHKTVREMARHRFRDIQNY